MALTERYQKEVIWAEGASAFKMQQEDAREALAEPLRGACEDAKQAKAYEEAEKMRHSPSSNGGGALLLPWGLGKRLRCSTETHNPAGNEMDNPNLKPGTLSDASCVLYHKTVHIQADKASAAQPNTNSYASKGNLMAKNSIVAKNAHLSSDERQNQQAKLLKGGPSDAEQRTRGSPLRAGKRGYSSLCKQDQSLQQRKTCAFIDVNPPSTNRYVTPLPGSNNFSLSKTELVWPKLVIALSQKEKEEDFLILKGIKLLQRPKPRPKAVKKALHYCSPGSCLIDITHSRYDVKEKRRSRKKPRGLKAMESLDNDSD